MHTRMTLSVALLAMCVGGSTHAQRPNDAQSSSNEKTRTSQREPFQHTIRSDWQEGSRTAGGSFQVPPNKRLVIEHVSGNFELLHEQEVISTVVATVADGERDLHYVHVPKSGTFNADVDNRSPGVERNLRPESELAIYSGGQQVRFYADPGSAVDVGVVRDDWICRFPCGTVIVDVSGYLLDARNPELGP